VSCFEASTAAAAMLWRLSMSRNAATMVSWARRVDSSLRALPRKRPDHPLVTPEIVLVGAVGPS
jgi:hypothetical protein